MTRLTSLILVLPLLVQESLAAPVTIRDWLSRELTRWR